MTLEFLLSFDIVMSIGVFPYEYSVLDGRGLDPFVVHALDLEAAEVILEEKGHRSVVRVLATAHHSRGYGS